MSVSDPTVADPAGGHPTTSLRSQLADPGPRSVSGLAVLRRLSLIGMVAAVAVLMAGCGDDDTTAAGDGGDETDGETSEDPIGGGPFPVADLTITITHPQSDDVEYRVVCLGDTATLSGDDVPIDEQEACRALGRADVVTRLVDGPPADQVCTEQYGGPDVAAIVGTIDEQAVDASIDRTNGCGISDWDTLLAGLLPPATGNVEG